MDGGHSDVSRPAFRLRRRSPASSRLVNTAFMMGGALGLAVLASLAASRTDTLLGSGDGRLAALTGGYRIAVLVGALFAAGAAAIGSGLLRPLAMAHEHSFDAETVEEAA